MFEQTERGDVFNRALLYDWLTHVPRCGSRNRAYARVADLIASLAPLRVLDVGTGTGALAIALKERLGDIEMHAVDPSEQMLARARLNGVRAGTVVHFRQAWAQELPYADNEFDAVTCAAVLHHIPVAQRAAAVAEMRRVLRPGARGVIVEIVPAGWFRGISPSHGHALRLEDCAQLLRDAKVFDVRTGRVSRWLLGYAMGTKPSPAIGT